MISHLFKPAARVDSRILTALLGAAAVSLILLLAVGCLTPTQPDTFTPTPFAPGPLIDFRRPDDGAVLQLYQRVSVYAVLQDAVGVRRADFVVDGVIVDTKPLTIASRRFDYLYNWQPDSLGQHALTIIGYNVNNVPGNPVSRFVTISNPPPSPGASASPTPWVVVVTATPPGPQSPTPTPWIIIVTSTPIPSAVPTATPYYLIVTATRQPPTQTPFVKVVTNTPVPPTATPMIVVVPYGQ